MMSELARGLGEKVARDERAGSAGCPFFALPRRRNGDTSPGLVPLRNRWGLGVSPPAVHLLCPMHFLFALECLFNLSRIVGRSLDVFGFHRFH